MSEGPQKTPWSSEGQSLSSLSEDGSRLLRGEGKPNNRRLK